MAGNESGHRMDPSFEGCVVSSEIIHKLQTATNLINEVLHAAKEFRPGLGEILSNVHGDINSFGTTMTGSQSGSSMPPSKVELTVTSEIMDKLQEASTLIDYVLRWAKGFRSEEIVPIVPCYTISNIGEQQNSTSVGHSHGFGLGAAATAQGTLCSEDNFENIKVEPGQEVQSESEHQCVCSFDALHRLAEIASFQLELEVKQHVSSETIPEPEQ